MVHTAPSHGAEDFATGVKYGLDATSNVDEKGIMRNGLPEYNGLKVFDANAPIIELLKKRGALLQRKSWCTLIRIAGAATIPSFSAPPNSGSSRWKRPCRAAEPCAAALWKTSKK